MSFLTRLSVRSGGVHTRTTVVRPKGLTTNRPVVIARIEESREEEETLSPLRTPTVRPVRRQETQEEPEAQRESSEEGEEEIATLRRQETDETEEVSPLRRQEGDETEEVSPLRGQETDETEEVSPLRRQKSGEEEKPLATLRRQAATEEEQLSPIRRQVEEEEEEEPKQAMRTIARQEEVPLDDTGQMSSPPTQEQLKPGAEPVSQEFAGEEEPSKLQALRREMASSTLTQASQQPQQAFAPGETHEYGVGPSSSPEVSSPSPITMPGFPERDAFNNMLPQGTGSNDARPNVIIDQLDVLIHEPAPPVNQHSSRPSRDRSLRARYLRRL